MYLQYTLLLSLYVTLLRGGIGFGDLSTGLTLNHFLRYKEAWYNFSAQEWRNLILNICMFIAVWIFTTNLFWKD